MIDDRLDNLSLHAEKVWQLGFGFLLGLQRPGGDFCGEVKWNTQLSSQYTIVSYLTEQPITEARRGRLMQHLRLHRTPDGAWGMHDDSPPTLFHTTLAYVALRLLGVPASDELTRPALAWLKASGGILGIPTWGKFWLALSNLYAWEGVNPMLPELWLMPLWCPVHPARLYNHTRQIYLAMAYLYARRFSANLSSIIRELRTELYDCPYEQVDFAGNRFNVAATDLYSQPTGFVRLGLRLLRKIESFLPGRLHQRALDECFAQILFDVRTSDYVSLSPVNGLLNLLALWERKHPDFPRAFEGIHYWYWEDSIDGMRAGGAHSHTWDTAFTIRAALAAPDRLRSTRIVESLRRAHTFLRDSQLREELTKERDCRRRARDKTLGGWCFSDQRHAWPVSDCTAEALRSIMQFEAMIPVPEPIAGKNLLGGIDFILSRQNSDGGFGSFERRRGPKWLELLNASEMFGPCMVEGSYVECTASCVAGLTCYDERFPGIRTKQIKRAATRGMHFLLATQRSDGSWEGAWGVNFTYATLFCIEGLLLAGLPAEHTALRHAASWLLRSQMPAGGWGEHWTSCLTGKFVAHPRPQVIMTSWALLALQRLGAGKASAAIERGIEWLVTRQLPNGDFPEEACAGVFFRTGLLHYSLYKNYFPLWAIGYYLKGCAAWS
jgi:squalene/oxidosqualene cyclase-like protein